MIKMDDYLIDRFQEAYDILWDYFGITKGCILMLVKFLCAFLLFIDSDTHYFWKAFWISAFIASAFSSYKNTHVPQTKGLYKSINKKALESRSGQMQNVKLYFIFPITGCFVVLNATLNNYIYCIIISLYLVSTYLITVLVKDREPKDLFTSPQLDY